MENENKKLKQKQTKQQNRTCKWPNFNSGSFQSHATLNNTYVIVSKLNKPGFSLSEFCIIAILPKKLFYLLRVTLFEKKKEEPRKKSSATTSLFIYLSSAKNILHKARKGHNINKYKNTGRGDATAMPITALPANRSSRYDMFQHDNDELSYAMACS